MDVWEARITRKQEPRQLSRLLLKTLALPCKPEGTASYNAFGDLVYSLKEKEKDSKGNPVFIAQQKFITVGETRGDQVQVLKGLERGELVVTAGQLKLKNGSLVVINNTALPSNNPTSHPKNE